jgi:hypothetical protein
MNDVDVTLPLTIAGPILRRVTSKLVTVWVALSRQPVGTLYLNLIDDQNVVVPTQPAASAGVVAESIIQLGVNLYVGCITRQWTGPTLDRARTYFYDVGEEAFPGATPTSYVPAGLTLVGSGGSGPSFVLPAGAINDVRILHGSCRKLHGGHQRDGLASALDLLQNSLGSNPQGPRPQQLYLTGDQIYGDDVHKDVLTLMRKLGIGRINLFP